MTSPVRIIVAKATPAQIDWLVTHIENPDYPLPVSAFLTERLQGKRAYSVWWSVGGPIIDRERTLLDPFVAFPGWSATKAGYEEYGDTPLLAAMGCYVVSKRGNEVNIPEELK